jgi:methionyl-tRNA formyltransferase
LAAPDPRPQSVGAFAPRVVFFGSPPFAVPIVERLVASAHRPVAVVTPPDRGRGRKRSMSPVAAVAEAAGVPLLRPDSARDAGFRDQLRSLEADVFLVASYGELFDDELLSMPKAVCLNVHGSVLPRWRGASPIQSAIMAGDTVTGVTIQRMVKRLDAGDVLLSRETPIGPDETSGELFDRLAVLGADVAIEVLDLIAAGQETYTPQDPELVTRCRKLDKALGELDWSEAAVALQRRVRAVTPWPGARTRLPDGRTLGLLRTRVAEDAPGSHGVGALLPEPLTSGRLVVVTGDGTLELLEVKPEGKRAMAPKDFLNGTALEAGAHLQSGSDS